MTKPSMVRHETMCAYNPARVCPLCKAEREEQRPLADIIAALETGLDAARDAANHCPACLLAAVVQSRRALEAAGELDKGDPYVPDFKYKDELQTWYENRENAYP